jgi:cytochrome c biogenesis protein CcdA/peroxiredoxin
MGIETPTLGLAFIAGLLSFVSPCVLPLVPAYIGYMGGRMTNSLSAQVALANGGTRTLTGLGLLARFNILLHGVFFVLGFTLIFVVIGLVTSSLILSARDMIGRFGGVVIILFGLHFMGVMPGLFKRALANPKWLSNAFVSVIVALLGTAFILWGFTGTLTPALTTLDFNGVLQYQIPTIAAVLTLLVFLFWLVFGGAFANPGAFWTRFITGIQQAFYTDTRRQMTASGNQGYLGSAFMGIVFAAGWSPCIGPILGSIFTLAASGASDSLSTGVLFATYSLGLGIPFLLTALLLDSARGGLKRLQKHMHKLELVTGGFLVVIGLLVATGTLQSLSVEATQRFSEFSLRVEECGIGLFTGDIGFEHAGPCFSGAQDLVEIGGTAAGTFSATTIQSEFIFRSAATDGLAITLIDRSKIIQAAVRLVDPARAEVPVTVSRPEPGDDFNTYQITTGSLPVEGIYTLTISNLAALTGDDTAAYSMIVRQAATETTTSQSTPATGLNTISRAAASVDGPLIGLLEGNRAPDFETTTPDGQTIRLNDLRGQVVLVNFWATWCGPCKIEMPEFQTAYDQYRAEGLTILAVNNMETAAQITDFRQSMGLTFPLLLDTDGSIQQLYGIAGYPTTFLIDREGVITAVRPGALIGDQVRELIDSAMR